MFECHTTSIGETKQFINLLEVCNKWKMGFYIVGTISKTRTKGRVIFMELEIVIKA